MIGKWLRRFRAKSLTNRAFFLVEAGDYQGAIVLLNRATQIDPSYGHAHNETAFVYGRKLRQFDLAEQAARRAIECDPHNPKFHNALLGITRDRVTLLKTRKEVLAQVGKLLREIDAAIAANPEYPPLRLCRAANLALCGRPEEEWQAEVDAARQLYGGRIRAASGLRLQVGDVDAILSRSRSECAEMARLWQKLSDA
jgi:tetratricopeptide (TPR) repeat protein